MIEVRTTGVYVIGECALRLPGCLALDYAPITIVKAQPSGRQVNVCSVCLQRMIDHQEWQVAGAGFQARYDFVLNSGEGEPLLILEIKRKPAGTDADELTWARSYVRNLIAHGRLRPGRILILSLLDGATYGWRIEVLALRPTLLMSVETTQAFADLGLEAPIRGLDEGFATSYYTDFVHAVITTGLSRGLPWVESLGLPSLPLDGARIESQAVLSR